MTLAPRRTIPLWLKLIVFVAGYLAAAQVGDTLSAQRAFPTLWPPAGLFVALLLISHRRDWPALVGTGLLVQMAWDVLHGRAALASFGYAAVLSVGALVAALLVRSVIGARPKLRTLRGSLAFSLIAGVFVPAVTALLGAYVVVRSVPGASYWTVWYLWSISTSLGTIALGAPILTSVGLWDIYRDDPDAVLGPTLRPILASILIALPFAEIAYLVFAPLGGGTSWKFLTSPGLVACGIVGGPTGLAISFMLITLGGMFGMVSGSAIPALANGALATHIFQAEAFFVVWGVGMQALAGVIAEDRAHAKASRSSAEELERMVYDVAAAMGSIVESRDPYTQGHQVRVAELSRVIGAELGLGEAELDQLKMAALLHDVGKLHVPSEILMRPGPLSEAEMDLVREHPDSGAEILRHIKFPWPIDEIVRQHHERMDGSGYPRGLSGDEILFAARIIAVADVVEALVSHRPYRAAFGLDEAMSELDDFPQKYDREVCAATEALCARGELDI